MAKRASESTGHEKFMARWYESFLTACVAAKRRNLGIVTHPKHKQAMMDMMERVAEDPLWNLGELPPLVVYRDMEPGTYQFFDLKTTKAIALREALKSNRGLGRFEKVWTADETLKRN